LGIWRHPYLRSKLKIYNNVVLTIMKIGRVSNSTSFFLQIFLFFQIPERCLHSSCSSGPKSFGLREANVIFSTSQPVLNRRQVGRMMQHHLIDTTHAQIPTGLAPGIASTAAVTRSLIAPKQAAEIRERGFICHAQHFPMEGGTLCHPDSLLHLG